MSALSHPAANGSACVSENRRHDEPTSGTIVPLTMNAGLYAQGLRGTTALGHSLRPAKTRHGTVRATRKPRVSLRLSAGSGRRRAGRISVGGRYQEPPRVMRWLQSPLLVQAEPSAGAPL